MTLTGLPEACTATTAWLELRELARPCDELVELLRAGRRARMHGGWARRGRRAAAWGRLDVIGLRWLLDPVYRRWVDSPPDIDRFARLGR